LDQKRGSEGRPTGLEVVSFGLGDLSASLAWNAVAAFALIFYTDVALLSAAAVGTLFFLTRIFDAFFDIGVGFFVDRTSSRWGKARPYLLFGALPFGLLTVLVFVTPEANQSIRFAWAAITYFLLGLMLSVTNIPYSAMLPMMARDITDKLKLSSARSVGTSVGVITVTALFMPAVNFFGGGDQERGFFITALVIAIFSSAMLLTTFANCRERNTLDTGDSFTLRNAVGSMLSNKAWLVVSIFALLNFVRFGAILALTPFFAINVLGQAWMISILLPTLSGMLLIGAFIAPPILRRTGMRKGNSVALVISIALYLALPFAQASPWLFIAIYVAASLVLSITMTAIFAMASDSVDYHEWRFGRRQEGLLSAGITFSIKVGMAIGGSIVAWGLAAGGYVPGAVTSGALNTMSVLYYGIPVTVLVLQLVFIQFYPVDALRNELNSSRK